MPIGPYRGAQAAHGAGVINLSVGEAFYPDDGSDAEQLLAEADRRMYKSKHSNQGGPTRGIHLLPPARFEKTGPDAHRPSRVN